jgi:transposase InsO family protein
MSSKSLAAAKKQATTVAKPDELTAEVIKSFEDSHKTYGTRRLKEILFISYGHRVSRRKIRRIMKANGLIPLAVYKNDSPSSDRYIYENCANLLQRNFNGKNPLEWLVSDLTYVEVNGKWCYICCILDLFNREIVGYSIGCNKTSQLVKEALLSIENLSKTKYFHTDCGSEFKGHEVVSFINNLGIRRSLSAPGCPNDNAVVESLYKTIKTEFVQFKVFDTLESLKNQFAVYVNWYNTKRLHSTLGNVSPLNYAQMYLGVGQAPIDSRQSC